MEPLEAFLGAKCRSASPVFLTKDLRHKRVFSPEVNSVSEAENDEEGKKLLKGFDASKAPASDDELEKSEIARSESERIDGENCLNLKDQAIPGNGSLPEIKTVKVKVKVFKSPSSFSYRRLLPHLMNIVNDTSCNSEIEIVDDGSPCKFPKLDGVNSKVRSIAENSYAAKTECVASRLRDSNPLENPDIEKVHKENSCIEPDLSSADNELEVQEKGGVNCLDEEHIQTTPPDPSISAITEDVYGREAELSVGIENSSMNHSPNAKCSSNSTYKTVLNPCSRLRLFKNPRSLSYRRLLPFLMDSSNTISCSSGKPVSEDDRHPHLIQNKPPFSPASSPRNNNNLVSESSNIVPTKYQLDLESKESSTTSSDALVSPNGRPFKGILKRSRRGCRGLCNCLNCASFRLHAERAFEFSRNQFHDAEEVAFKLMKELSNLRLLLQKSTTENSDSSNIRPHPVLIKQACDEALEAEILAKERLNELNTDLSDHCKTPAREILKEIFAAGGLSRRRADAEEEEEAEKKEMNGFGYGMPLVIQHFCCQPLSE